jgi:membrane-associated phospholipid phosphatase
MKGPIVAAPEPANMTNAPARLPRPKSLRPRWWIPLLGGLLAAAALPCDRYVTGFLTGDRIRPMLERVVAAPLSAGIYIVILAILASFPNRRRLWVGFLTAVLLSTGVLHALKWAIGRARPLAHQGAFHFEPFSGSEYCDAFPSGHTASAGTLAILLGIYVPPARGIFYLLAGLIGLERMVTDWHFLSDVLAGYALAAAVVAACVRVLGPSFYDQHGQFGPSPAGA